MENIKIALVSDDREYGRALGMGLLNVCRSLVIRIMSKEGFFAEMHRFHLEHIQEPFSDEFDIILWDGEEARESYGGNLVFLAEKPSMINKDIKRKKFSIYKYSCAQCFVSEIFDIYSSITGNAPVNPTNRSVDFIAFASWAGGTGCSTLSMMVGRELCRFYGKRVLYLSLEEVESTQNFIESYSGSKTMGQYLYHLYKEHGKRPFIESYIIKDEFGVEAFVPTRGRNPLKSMESDEFMVFLESVANSGRYDVILMDLGNDLSSVNTSCIEIAERICFVCRPENNRYRETHYIQYLICHCGEKTLDKVVKVENMCLRIPFTEEDNRGKGQADKEDELLETRLHIKKGTYFIGEDGVKRVSGDGEMGKRISTLTKILTEPTA